MRTGGGVKAKGAERNHIVRHDGWVTRSDRNSLNRHCSGLVWFTGLSAAGKSTIAHAVERELFGQGVRAYVIDGDNVRHGINSDLGFSRKDRGENLRRIAEVAHLFADAGILVLASFISPYRMDRERLRKRFGPDEFLEVYVKCSAAECERRDPKGFYKKAREGAIKGYTGVSAPYEKPMHPDLVIDTERLSIARSVDRVLSLLRRKWHVGRQALK